MSIIDRIDADLAANGHVVDDPATSPDAMSWTTQPTPDPFGDVIHTYSRAQAIADGVLVAVDGRLSRDAGITVPVALTAAAWADCVAWTDADTYRTGACQGEVGRLWDVLWMLRYAIRRARGSASRVDVDLYRVPRDCDDDAEAELVRLVAVCGPGDDAEPVITIGLPGED